jgi:tubulin--tyrosine ligase
MTKGEKIATNFEKISLFWTQWHKPSIS